MTARTKAELKDYELRGYKPEVGTPIDLIDSMANLTDDAATDAEALAETSVAKFLTPKNLAALGASATFAGLVELATDAEVISGASTTRAVTPANLAAAVTTHVAAASASVAGKVELAIDAEAKTGTDTARAVTPANLRQGANLVTNATVKPAFLIHYQFAPITADTDYVHAAITLPAADTTVVTTAITNPDFPRIVSVTGNALGITGNVVIDGTDAAGTVIQDTIALNGTDTVLGVKAFKTVTSITVPARNAEGDTVIVGVGNKFGMPVVVAYGGFLLAYLFDGAVDTGGTLAATATLSTNLYTPAGTPNGVKKFDLVFLV